MLTSIDQRRRWFGAFFLIIAGGLLLWGLTFLKDWLMERPFLFLVYWFSCFGLTGLAFAVAVYDLFVIRRRVRTEKRAAFERAFRDIGEEDGETR